MSSRRCPRLYFAGTLLLITAPADAQQTRAAANTGWQFSYVVSTSDPTNPANVGRAELDVTIWRGAVRVVPKNGELVRIAGRDGFVVLAARDSVLQVVNPTRRSVLRVRRDELSAMGNGPQAGAVQEFSATSRVRGRGAPVAGFPTQRSELAIRYALAAPVGAPVRRLQYASTSELDASAAIARLDAGFGQFVRHFVAGGGPGALSAQQQRTLDSQRGGGFPVQARTQIAIATGGDTVSIRSDASVTNLRRVTIDTVQFLIPAAFLVTDASRLLQRSRPPARPAP